MLTPPAMKISEPAPAISARQTTSGAIFHMLLSEARLVLLL